MPHLALQIPRDDAEFRIALEKQFEDKVTLVEVKSFDGIESCQVIIDIALPFAPKVVDFLVGHLRKDRRRIVLTPKGEISLENYSVDEAKDLLFQFATHAVEE